jgi:hypothetical protein
MCKICDEYYGEADCVCIGREDITFGRGTLEHDVWIMNGSLYSYLTDGAGNTLGEVSVPIKYCPFCGEEIKQILKEELS